MRSWMGRKRLAGGGGAALAVCTLCAAGAWAQYPGQVAKSTKEQPVLRAISVVEWIGDFGTPKACRLVPVAVLDAGELHDGGIYMARPQPLALAGEVEYELEQNGQTVGLFDVENSGQEQGAWVGYGKWRKAPAPKAKADPLSEMAKLDVTDDAGDRPVLHRKHSKPGAKGEAGPETQKPGPPPDPDRPTMHRKDSASVGGGTVSAAGNGSAGGSASTPSTASASQPDEAPDPDRPTIRKRGNSAPTADDPDRPTVKKGKKKKEEDIGRTDAVAGAMDPDRPKLKRGKSGGSALEVKPSLMGMPPDMEQAVAVSDATDRKEHTWGYTWANADDEAKMMAALEDLAMADNRAELLFELRGAAQRQFALYRVLRGRAEQIFAGGGGEFGLVAKE